MKRQRKRSANADLPEPPSKLKLMVALIELEDSGDRRYIAGVTAQMLAWRTGVVGARRLGNGAVQGSWSGTMSPSIRVAPALRGLALDGFLDSWFSDGRNYYTATLLGRRFAAGDKSAVPIKREPRPRKAYVSGGPKRKRS